MTPVKTTKTSRNAAMMTSTSLMVLGLFCAAPAMAQSTVTGAPGQALTAGTVSTSNGGIYLGSTGDTVGVYTEEGGDTQTATGAEIITLGQALNFGSDAWETNLLTVVIDGNSRIESAYSNAVSVDSWEESVLFDLSSGGNTVSAGGNALGIYSYGAGSITVRNGANTIHSGARGLVALSTGGDITIDSVGGTIEAFSAGILTDTDGSGNIVIGQGSGVTTAISMYAQEGENGPYSPGLGISASSYGAGTIDIRTGAGGTIDGGQTGIYAGAEQGATTINVGAAIGGVTAPSNAGVSAVSQGGEITVNTTAAVSGNNVGLRLENEGGGSLTANIGGDVTSNGSGVVMLVSDPIVIPPIVLPPFPFPFPPMPIFASAAIAAPVTTGDATLTLDGPVAIHANGQYGVNIQTTSGAINFTALDGLSSVTATEGAGVSLVSATGDIDLTFNGAISATGGSAVYAETAGNIDLQVGSAAAVGGSGTVGAPIGNGIRAVSNGGSVDVAVTGSVSSTAASGVYARTTGGNGNVNVTVGGPISAGTGHGVSASTTNTDGDLTISAGAVTATHGVGIYAVAVEGSVDVSTTGAVQSYNSGIYTQTNGAGTITIHTADAVSNQSGSAVYANTYGTGTINIGTADQRLGGLVTSAGGRGVVALGAGDISIYAGAVTASDDAVVGSSQWDGTNGRVLLDVSGPVVSTYGVGIYGENDGVLSTNTLTIRAADAVTGGQGNEAINAWTMGGDIDITALGAVTSTPDDEEGNLGDGILATSEDQGNISITATGSSVTGASGIYASSVARRLLMARSGEAVASPAEIPAGNIDIHTTGAVSGLYGYGIFAEATNGSVNIVSGGSVTGRYDAIYASSEFGNVSVTTADATSAYGTGVSAEHYGSGAGDVRVDVTGASTVSGDTGVYVWTAGSGSVTVTSDTLGSTLIGTDGEGVDAQANGGLLTIDLAGGVTGYGSAVYAGNSGSGAIDIAIGGPVSGQSGVQAWAESGAIDINLTGPVTATSGYGVRAENDDGGDITIHTAAVTSEGSDLTARSGPGYGGYSGIRAVGYGDSLISVATTGAVTGLGYGIEAYSYGSTARSGVDIVAGGSVTGGDEYSAIGVNLYDQGSAHVRTTAGTTLSAAGGAGIHVNVWAEEGTNDVLIDNFASIGGADAGQVNTGLNAWIAEVGNAGSIAINSTGGTIHATERGILAQTYGSGSINIGGTAGISSAIIAGHTGIQAQTTTGAIDIRTATGGTIAPGAVAGIFAMSDTGAITINQAGAIGAAGAGNTVDLGILAIIDSGDAALTINSTGGIYVTAGTGLQSAGIYAVHNGTGAVSVTTSGIIDPGAYGVVVQGGGDVSYTATGGLVEGDLGIYANSTTGGTVGVTSLTGSTIRGLNGVGVQAEGTGGAVNVAAGGAVTGSTSGVTASNTGTGATTVAVTGSAVGQNGAGINVTGSSGLTTVSALGNVSGTTAGISASTATTGTLAVTSGGSVSSATGPAMNLTAGTGGLQLNLGGNVSSGSGPAVVATTTGSAVVNVAAGAVISGLVNSATDSVIALNTASGTSSTINVAQGATIQASSGSAFTTAIRATGGSVAVNNSGNIIGQIDFSALTGANVGSISSGVGTTFQTGGLSVFSTGDDTFVNGGQLITAGQTTTFDFRGGNNVFNNSGTVIVGTVPVNPAGSVFRLISLTTLNNSGTLSMINGVAGDSLIAPGAAYVGSGAARLSVDTSIAGSASASDVFTVGSTSGRTSVLINDVTPTGSFSANNPTGVVIVSGTVHEGDFVLDAGSSYYNANVFGGVIESRGMFYSQLAVDPARGLVLFSAPKVQAYQFATMGRQAQAVWHDTAPRTERQAEVRDQLANGSATGGFWADVNGSRLSRDASQSAINPGGAVTYDTSYDQDVVSTIIGFDRVAQSGAASWAIGGSIGNVQSKAEFSQGDGSIDMSGLVVSGYASVVRDGMFVSASVGFNKLNADIKAEDLAGFTTQDTDIRSLGAAVDLGTHTAFADGTVFESSLGLAYVDSMVDGFAAAGAAFGDQNAESLRVSLGVRMSGAFVDGGSDWASRYHVSVRGIGEVLGDNRTALTSGGPSLTLADRFDKPFGELRAGVTSQNSSGWSVYGDGMVRYNSDYSDVGVTVGLRLKY